MKDHDMTDQVSRPALEVPVQGPVGRALRTALAVLLRLVLIGPVRLVRAVACAIVAAGNTIDHRLERMERAIWPVCELPFHAEVRRELAAAEGQARLELLRRLADSAPRF